MITKDPADEFGVVIPVSSKEAATVEALTAQYQQAWSELIALTVFNELPERPSPRRRE